MRLKALEQRMGVPKAIAAVAHRRLFTVYPLWKKGVLYEETDVKRYGAKRRRLSQRAAEALERSSMAATVDRRIGPMGPTGATTRAPRPYVTGLGDPLPRERTPADGRGRPRRRWAGDGGGGDGDAGRRANRCAANSAAGIAASMLTTAIGEQDWSMAVSAASPRPPRP